jgi:hypothetical protein
MFIATLWLFGNTGGGATLMPKAPSRNRGQPGGFRNARCHCGVAAEGLVINLVLENVM